MTTLHSGKSIGRLPLRLGFLLTAALACFALLPVAKAVSPPPDGGYPNGNTAEGDNALSNLNNGANNTAIGFQALFNDTRGDDNTATGFQALLTNTAGHDNTATGVDALLNNTTGHNNTASGVDALADNTTGKNNTASGFQALFRNTTGEFNTATGADALLRNTTGVANTANGTNALQKNTTGSENTAIGASALFKNTTGLFNTATGTNALIANTTGFSNTANGVSALLSNTTGDDNMASGADSLHYNRTGSENTAVGVQALFFNNGNGNIALGSFAGRDTTGDNNIDIGNAGVIGESNKIRIGTEGTHMNTFIAGISGVTVPGGVGVIIDANGQLGTVSSSERFKDEIKPMDKVSEAILKLQPVTFRYKHELDPVGIPQFGLVAEQVEKVDSNLVARDEEGKPYTVRYEAVNAMLLNEFLKAHRRIEKQDGRLQKQETAIAKQQKQIEALTTGLQKVSARLEVSEPAPQTVRNNQ